MAVVNGNSTKGNENYLFSKLIPFFETWVFKIVLGAICWYGSEIYSEFKGVKEQMKNIQQEMQEVKTSIDFLRNYDLKKK